MKSMFKEFLELQRKFRRHLQWDEERQIWSIDKSAVKLIGLMKHNSSKQCIQCLFRVLYFRRGFCISSTMWSENTDNLQSLDMQNEK